MAFEHLEPWGFKPAQLRAGQICAILANVNRKRGSKAFKPTEFLVVEARVDGVSEAVEAPESIHAKATLITEMYKAVAEKHGHNR